MDESPLFQHHDLVSLPFDGLLRTHPETACEGDFCSIHNPSDHPLRDAPQAWDSRLHSIRRVCEHNYVHPDVDDLNYKATIFDAIVVAFVNIHNCDGCCSWPKRDEDAS